MNDLIYQKILEYQKSNQACVLVTVVDKSGHGPAQPGFKMIYSQKEGFSGTVGGGNLEFEAIKTAQEILVQKKSRLKTFLLSDKDESVIKSDQTEQTNMLCGGKIGLFFEYLDSLDQLFVFGCGHIGQAIFHMVKDFNIELTMLDSRREWLEKDQLNCCQKQCDYHDLSGLDIDFNNHLVVIATHSHDYDYLVLKQILMQQYRPRYVGLIASRPKIKAMKKRLDQELDQVGDLSFLYSPAGLNIGGKTPPEIALAIVSEIQTIRYRIDRPGFMRDL